MNHHNEPKKIGILINNLGTPEAPTSQAVRIYLREFLSDVRVIKLPKPLRWLILNFVILPFRPRKSAKAYRSIWTNQGSPLLVTSQKQALAISDYLKRHSYHNIYVELAMRYGKPSIKQALLNLEKKQIDSLIVLPLYPQYSTTTTASTFDEIARLLKKFRTIPHYHFIGHYYDNPAYINTLAEQVKLFWNTHQQAEQLILSFHGLPQAHIDAGDPYYDQCQTTATLLTKALKIPKDNWMMTFQSRLGKTPWIEPYTDASLKKLAKTGTQTVQVICPGFSADCLETLAEIALENKEIFLKAGGKKYEYIPCLNDQKSHIALLGDLILNHPM